MPSSRRRRNSQRTSTSSLRLYCKYCRRIFSLCNGPDPRETAAKRFEKPDTLKFYGKSYTVDLVGASLGAARAAEPLKISIGWVAVSGDMMPLVFEQGAHTLFTMRDDGMGRSQMIVMVARESFLRRHRAALDDFFADFVRGIHWTQNPADRDAAIKFV